MNPSTWPDGTPRSTGNDFNWRGPSVINWGRIKTDRQMLLDATRENIGTTLANYGRAAITRGVEYEEYKRSRFGRSPIVSDNKGARVLLQPRQMQPFLELVHQTIAYAGDAANAARLLNVAPSTLRRMLRKGQLTVGMGHRIVAAHKLIAHHLS